MSPPELNGSSLFLEFGGRKGRPTPLIILGDGRAEKAFWQGDIWVIGFEKLA